MHWLIAAFYAVAGVAFLLLSGRAEGLFEPRVLLGGLVLLIALAHLAYVGVVFLLSLMSRRFRAPARQLTAILGITVLGACYYWGTRIDLERVDETQRVGEELLIELEKHKAATGACPESLDELEAFADGLPEPAIRDSKFEYSVTKDGQCLVAFHGPAFISCSRNTEDTDWFCD